MVFTVIDKPQPCRRFPSRVGTAVAQDACRSWRAASIRLAAVRSAARVHDRLVGAMPHDGSHGSGEQDDDENERDGHGATLSARRMRGDGDSTQNGHVPMSRTGTGLRLAAYDVQVAPYRFAGVRNLADGRGNEPGCRLSPALGTLRAAAAIRTPGRAVPTHGLVDPTIGADPTGRRSGPDGSGYGQRGAAPQRAFRPGGGEQRLSMIHAWSPVGCSDLQDGCDRSRPRVADAVPRRAPAALGRHCGICHEWNTKSPSQQYPCNARFSGGFERTSLWKVKLRATVEVWRLIRRQPLPP